MRILIVGAGDVGFQLGRRLTRAGHDVTMIEADPQKSKRAAEQLDIMVVEGNGGSWQTLRDAQVERTDILAAVTDQDEVNVTACRMGKKMGAHTTIARVRNPEYTAEDFVFTSEELGVDHFIQPEQEAADAIVRLIRQSSANYAVEFDGGKIQLLGLHVEAGSPLLYRPLTEIGQDGHHPPFTIVAINRNHDTLIPNGTDRLMPGDQVFVICDPTYACQFTALAGKPENAPGNIMILGGGMVGAFVAQTLEKETHVKIVESKFARCERLAETLPRTLVIHGDGTDLELLESEDLAEMDAFIAVTGDDERNIIAALLARHANVPRNITLVNRVGYLPIMPKIGLDTVVSKQLLTVNAVQHYIQHKDVAAVASLPGIEAQLIEYIAKDGCRMTKKRLRDIRFPRNAIVGAILHDNHMIVPDGDTRIEQGDRTVVFALPQAIGELDYLFGR
ncbi:MAG: Trk system potassium transporter TrkA [Caldilineaceae bacterium]|nr:Trk system potassium transporter TrkA [Caldilineaceae bacterium]